MFDIKECTVRLARPEDSSDLIEISRYTWDGNDYLPRIIDLWISQPWFFVCEYQGKVIGCLKLSQFPDQVLWFEGLRVHKAFRGKGIAKLLNLHVSRFAAGLKKEDPRLSFEFCTYYKNIENIGLTTSLGFKPVDGFYNMEKRGVHKSLKPDFVASYAEEIFAHYPLYLPLNWHAVHSNKESLSYIREHAQVFKTQNASYLVGSTGERCITMLSPPHNKMQEDLPYLQHFFGARKRINITLSSQFKPYLALLKKLNFYFWDEEKETALNMIVFHLPS